MSFRRKSSRPRQKQLSAQGLLGQKGINLIEQIVLDMKSRWTASGPNEIGIDGYIELFDSVSLAPLGKTVAVQSKAFTAFPNQSPEAFELWCDRRDLEYWLAGNMPVLLIASCPASREAYWVSVKDYFRDSGGAGSPRVRFSKSENRLTAASVADLVRVAESRELGLYLTPPPKAERLHSNLLAVSDVPSTIYVAQTECRTPTDVWQVLARSSHAANRAWILREKLLLTFNDLEEEPWSLVCDRGTLESHGVREWSESTDEDRRRQFVQLLNQTLRSQLDGVARYWPGEDCYAFEGSLEQRQRKIAYRSAKRPSSITVVKKYGYTTAAGNKYEWLRHLAFRGRFRALDGSLYLEITPTYRFTRDGHSLDRFHAERLTGIKKIEGNRAVLSAVLLWADVLRRPGDLFEHRAQLIRFGDLLAFKLPVGIADAAWAAADTSRLQKPHDDELFLPLPDIEFD